MTWSSAGQQLSMRDPCQVIAGTHRDRPGPGRSNVRGFADSVPVITRHNQMITLSRWICFNGYTPRINLDSRRAASFRQEDRPSPLRPVGTQSAHSPARQKIIGQRLLQHRTGDFANAHEGRTPMTLTPPPSPDPNDDLRRVEALARDADKSAGDSRSRMARWVSHALTNPQAARYVLWIIVAILLAAGLLGVQVDVGPVHVGPTGFSRIDEPPETPRLSVQPSNRSGPAGAHSRPSTR